MRQVYRLLCGCHTATTNSSDSIFFRSLWKNIDCFLGASAAASMSAERDICVTDAADWLRQNKVIP